MSRTKWKTNEDMPQLRWSDGSGGWMRGSGTVELPVFDAVQERLQFFVLVLILKQPLKEATQLHRVQARSAPERRYGDKNIVIARHCWQQE
jgi:hypothetical protein